MGVLSADARSFTKRYNKDRAAFGGFGGPWIVCVCEHQEVEGLDGHMERD